MSSETIPISNLRFAAALKDLSLASLHLKTLEIRNSLAHLAYSNAQLRPFAEGLQPTLDTAASATTTTSSIDDNNTRFEPDPDCVEAIRENEAVMLRMHERIALVRAEVEGRGVSWREFEVPEDVPETEPGVIATATAEETRGGSGSGSLPLTNGMNGHVDGQENTTATPAQERSSTTTTSGGNPWTDGTFQTGVIRNGQIHMDNAVPRSASGYGDGTTSATETTTAAASSSSTTTNTGGRLTDEDLRRLLEQRLGEDEDDEADGGLHL